MATKNSISISEIQRILQEKVDTCALCGGSDWELEPELLFLRLGTMSNVREIKNKQVRCVLLVCNTCGNTHIININTLAHNERKRKIQENPDETNASELEEAPPLSYLEDE